MYSYTSTVVLADSINHDETQLKITNGLCHPYPAVDEDGNISGGLKHTGPRNGKCEGPALGSQIYSRTTWFSGLHAIMYAWYFPKRPNFRRTSLSTPTDNATPSSATIQGVPLSTIYLPKRYAPPHPKDSNGSSFKCTYTDTGLKATEDSGEFQDIVTWE
ncbi:hypothetical protein JG687_00014263 [Phytophthora cactorum]|uniref:Necrosis inducing protein n=1 Tax=Phytophthora cactorum TaxID=29920 RepID=A0A8T1U0B1_9STRA|nr:hypothetical protein JG687_00014263 [Phytophthora cactorum]